MHGIRLAIRMAEQLGKTEEVDRWKKLFNRIGKGILQHLVDDSEFGPIWHTYEHCDWQDHAHKLVHLQLATEGDTFTPLDDYAQGSELDRIFLEIDLNTYKYLMRDKNYNCLRMYGYGQGMMTQSALLMDQMRDAERFIEKLVRFAYLPKFGRWLAPEGIIVHKSGKYSVPVNCYMGQDSHVADSTKALRLMLGVDDNHPEQLKLVPRFPVEWEKASINDFPVLLPGGRRKVSYRYERTEEFQQFEYRFDDILQKLDVRLGPLPTGKSILSILLDGVEKEFQEMFSGDSRWVWIRNLTGSSGVIRVMLG